MKKINIDITNKINQCPSCGSKNIETTYIKNKAYMHCSNDKCDMQYMEIKPDTMNKKAVKEIFSIMTDKSFEEMRKSGKFKFTPDTRTEKQKKKDELHTKLLLMRLSIEDTIKDLLHIER